MEILQGHLMRSLLAILIVAAFCHPGRCEEENPLKGLDGVKFNSAVMTMPGVTISKERLARTAEEALKKAGILKTGETAADYPLLVLTVHGAIKGNLIFFVWELQLKEKVEIPANKTYRRTAFQGTVVVWQTSGMMSTDTANMELALMAQVEKAMKAFVRKWQEANPAESTQNQTKETKN